MSHSSVTDLGLKHVLIEKSFTILDVGCGGGRTIQKMAAIATEGMVYGIDYAEGSVAASRGKNAQLIDAGSVEIRQASVSQLPFPDDKFDLVTAVETQYYWPDLVKDMQEILRRDPPLHVHHVTVHLGDHREHAAEGDEREHAEVERELERVHSWSPLDRRIATIGEGIRRETFGQRTRIAREAAPTLCAPSALRLTWISGDSGCGHSALCRTWG